MTRRPEERASLCKLACDRRGAAYVEFLIAFPPIFLMFLGLWQLGIMFVASLVVQHAAVCAARAAAVAIAEPVDTPHTLGDFGRVMATDAAYLAASPLLNGGAISSLSVEFPSDAGGAGERTTYQPSSTAKPSMVRVRVKADFVCAVTPVNVLVCGLNGAGGGGATTTQLTAEASFPYQGANYRYAPEDGGTGTGADNNSVRH
jgi:Flp pilus assembly protein TadG